METARVNEVLAGQIAVIGEFSRKLQTGDLQQLAKDLSEIENALNVLKEYLSYLPKK